MLAQHEGMNVLLVHVQLLSQRGAQAGGIQLRARADNAALRDAGNLGEHIGQNVDGVADDDIDRIGSVLGDLLRDALQNVDVGLRQLKPGLAGAAGNAGGDDHDVGIGRVRIIAGVDINRLANRRRLINIHGLAQRLFLGDIDEQNLGRQALNSQRKADRRAYVAGADDSNLLAHVNPFLFAVYRF